MITLGPLLIFFGVLALVGTYVSIVHWFIKSGEENTSAENSNHRTASDKDAGHAGHPGMLSAAGH